MKDNKEIYKVAVIGCGWIAEDKHIPGLKANKDVEIVALCDISVEKANRLAKMYGTDGCGNLFRLQKNAGGSGNRHCSYSNPQSAAL